MSMWARKVLNILLLFSIQQITQLKIKYNPFAKAFLDVKEKWVYVICTIVSILLLKGIHNVLALRLLIPKMRKFTLWECLKVITIFEEWLSIFSCRVVSNKFNSNRVTTLTIVFRVEWIRDHSLVRVTSDNIELSQSVSSHRLELGV